MSRLCALLRFRCSRNRTALYLSYALSCVWPLPAYADDKTNTVFSYELIGGVAFPTVIALATVRSYLLGSAWSLSDALSEEADVSPLDNDGKPVLGPGGKLRASSSRFIALIGLIGILMVYIGGIVQCLPAIS